MRSWERIKRGLDFMNLGLDFVVIVALISPQGSHDRATIVVLDYLFSAVRWRSGELGGPDRTIKFHADQDQRFEHPPSDGDPPPDEASTFRWRSPLQMSPHVALIEFRDCPESRSFDEDQTVQKDPHDAPRFLKS